VRYLIGTDCIDAGSLPTLPATRSSRPWLIALLSPADLVYVCRIDIKAPDTSHSQIIRSNYTGMGLRNAAVLVVVVLVVLMGRLLHRSDNEDEMGRSDSDTSESVVSGFN
jgi:hypothetical protein